MAVWQIGNCWIGSYSVCNAESAVILFKIQILMTNCHVSLGSKSKLWSPQRTQTAGFSAILIALWTMKKTIDTRIQIPNNRNTPIPEIIFFHRKIQPFQNIFLNVANWYRILTNTNKVCKISWSACWFSYPRANLDGTARAKSCPSIGPSFSRSSVRWNHWTEHVAVGTDVMEPKTPITHPRIHGS